MDRTSSCPSAGVVESASLNVPQNLVAWLVVRRPPRGTRRWLPSRRLRIRTNARAPPRLPPHTDAHPGSGSPRDLAADRNALGGGSTTHLRRGHAASAPKHSGFPGRASPNASSWSSRYLPRPRGYAVAVRRGARAFVPSRTPATVTLDDFTKASSRAAPRPRRSSTRYRCCYCLRSLRVPPVGGQIVEYGDRTIPLQKR